MRVSMSAAIVSFFLLPSFVFAAGFAKQSMFLSQETVTAGETVFLYAVVQNDTASAFSGTLKFADASGAIGSTPVSLQSGAAATVSVSWKPTAGEHDVSANLTSTSGAVIESEDTTFLINPKLAPATAQTSGGASATTNTSSTLDDATSSIESSQLLQQWVASTSPVTATYTAPILKSVDTARSAGASKLDAGSNWAKQMLAKETVAPSGWLNTLLLIASTAVLYICSVLLYVVENIGIFYPLFALVFFYIVWRLYRLARRR